MPRSQSPPSGRPLDVQMGITLNPKGNQRVERICRFPTLRVRVLPGNHECWVKCYNGSNAAIEDMLPRIAR
jgi:hypothetical protein